MIYGFKYLIDALIVQNLFFKDNVSKENIPFVTLTVCLVASVVLFLMLKSMNKSDQKELNLFKNQGTIKREKVDEEEEILAS
jgi:uncharacterized protein YacL